MNSDPRDYILDLSTAPPAQEQADTAGEKAAPARYLSIYFKCCRVYAPIYKNAAGTAYAGHCPRCQRPAVIPVAPGGSTARIFEAE